MRSLMTKLVLAFLLTSLAGIVLASLFIRQFVTREFDDYVVQQERATFVADASDYYERRGSWDGVERWLRRGPPGSQRQRARFGLVDEAGQVVLPFEGHKAGDRLAGAALQQGQPISSGGRTIGTVITLDRPTPRDDAAARYLSRTDTALLLAGAVTVGIALVLGAVLARLITRPVRDLSAATRRIAGGDLGQRVPVRSGDELGMLATQFNQMTADLAHATQLRRQMTADIAHDLRTPLTVVSGYIEALRDQVLQPTPERFATIYEEIQLLRHLVDDLHTLAIADAGELRLTPQPIAPRLLLDRVADSYRQLAEQRHLSLEVQADQSLPLVVVDTEHMLRALGNLLANALRYTPAGGQVRLIGRAVPGGVQLVVADTGVGLAPEHLPNVFERFFRVDAARHNEGGGSGLGLAIVKSIVEAHGGQVAAASAPGQGASFTITLPLARA